MSSSKPVILMSAGGHAKVLAEALKLSGRSIIGIVDPNESPGSFWSGIKVLGNDDAIFSYLPEEVDLANGIGSLPGHNLRWQVAARMRKKGYNFATILHPSAITAKDVDLSEGVQIMAGAIIQPGTQLGVDSIVNTGGCVDHDCVIDRNCHIAPGVTISGGVSIGANTHVGTGAVIVQGISIGSDSVIAAGSIIHENVESNTTIIQPRANKVSGN